MTIDINKLRRLAQAATPGPWKVGQYLGSPRQFVIHMDVGDKGRGSDVAFTSANFGNDETIANARLIAAANPTAISELLDRLEAAEKAINEAYQRGYETGQEEIEKERDELRAKIERMDEAMESLLIRCDDSDSVMYGTLSTSFVRDTVRIARDALEETT